jgi:hypothetical protein
VESSIFPKLNKKNLNLPGIFLVNCVTMAALRPVQLSDIMFIRPRIHDKRKEVLPKSFSSDRLSQIPPRFKGDALETSTPQNQRLNKGMPESKKGSNDYCTKVSLVNRQDHSHHKRHVPSKVKFACSSPRQESRPKQDWIEWLNNPICRIPGSIKLVDKPLTSLA